MAPFFLCAQEENFIEVLAIFQGVKKYVYLIITIHNQVSLLLSFPFMCKNLYKMIFCLEKIDSITATERVEISSTAGATSFYRETLFY